MSYFCYCPIWGHMDGCPLGSSGDITYTQHTISIPYFQTFDDNKGWICPKCDRAYSPSTPECYKCNDGISISGGNDFEISYDNDFYSQWSFTDTDLGHD